MHLAAVVQRAENFIQWINRYPLQNVLVGLHFI